MSVDISKVHKSIYCMFCTISRIKKTPQKYKWCTEQLEERIWENLKWAAANKLLNLKSFKCYNETYFSN